MKKYSVLQYMYCFQYNYIVGTFCVFDSGQVLCKICSVLNQNQNLKKSKTKGEKSRTSKEQIIALAVI